MPTAYQLTCADAGNEDCAFMVRSEDRDEAIDLGIEHAREVHDQTYERNQVRDILEQVDWSAS